MYTYMHACMRTYIHTYIHAYIHTYIHTYKLLNCFCSFDWALKLVSFEQFIVYEYLFTEEKVANIMS